MNRCIVLGRFQPFHLGHAGLVEAAIEHAKGGPVIVAIGSAQATIHGRFSQHFRMSGLKLTHSYGKTCALWSFLRAWNTLLE